MKCAFLIILFVSQIVCAQKTIAFADQISKCVFASSKVMMHDVVNPPAASRYYAYILLGAYEIVAQNDSTLPPLSALIKMYTVKPTSAKSLYDYRVAALYCILETGRLMLPSGHMLKEDEEQFVTRLRKQKMDTGILNRSVAVANDMAKHIVSFSKSDRYSQLSARLRYTPVKGEGFWYPTPPAYIEAVEPNWKIVRPMFLDSCNEFTPVSPVVFSKDSTSGFYKLAREVYDVSKTLSGEQLAMAAFWDCNPFAVSTSGHMSIGYKKISPGGHWMNIAGITASKARLDFNKSVLLHTILSATIMDAFISCWDEKYRSNRIRPETFINRHMDVRWQPVLQTPPFPEYPSGHSVISTASAEVLTWLLGENFSFKDDSELMFDLPVRSFTSFKHAANEAAISRLYGGIHFRDAIESGQQEGAAVGGKVITKIAAAGVSRLCK